MTKFDLDGELQTFVAAHQVLCRHYSHTKLRFTLDGRLVGDLAEVIAAKLFNLELCTTRTPGVDAHAPDGRSVQIKATGLPNAGPAFTPGEGIADHLIFIRLNFAAGKGEIAYNGPEAPIRALLPYRFTGTKRVRLNRVLNLDKTVDDQSRLIRVQ